MSKDQRSAALASRVESLHLPHALLPLTEAEDPAFFQLVILLATEISKLSEVPCEFSEYHSAQDQPSFDLEMLEFLRSRGCPDGSFWQEGTLQHQEPSIRMDLLEFLCGELQAERLVAKASSGGRGREPAMTAAENLQGCCNALQVPHNSPSHLLGRVKQLVAEVPAGHLGETLVGNLQLTDKQREVFGQINSVMEADYTSRRKMLLKRLDVTVQSFMWVDQHATPQENEKRSKLRADIQRIYQSRRARLSDRVSMSEYDVLTARSDLTVVEKTSGARESPDVKSHVKDLMMVSEVPDRGGRVSDQNQMPVFKKRKAEENPGPGPSKLAKSETTEPDTTKN